MWVFLICLFICVCDKMVLIAQTLNALIYHFFYFLAHCLLRQRLSQGKSFLHVLSVTKWCLLSKLKCMNILKDNSQMHNLPYNEKKKDNYLNKTVNWICSQKISLSTIKVPSPQFLYSVSVIKHLQVTEDKHLTPYSQNVARDWYMMPAFLV